MIVAIDEAIPFAEAAFASLGELRVFSGRAVSAADLRDAEALIVRSVTKVGAGLLEGSRIRFVGTATIGMDHLDLDYLQAHGIHVANAEGCNANAVAEYVVAALLATAEQRGWNLSAKSLGIVGVGHIGSLVEKKAAALGMRVLLCDPPLREGTHDEKYGFLDDVLDADILTFHVPLTVAGKYPTRHMLARTVLERLGPSQFIINSSRGSVVCGPDLKQALMRRRIEGAILDVWEGEPAIDCELLDWVDLGTPHIAGFSLDGKVRATAMIREELCRFLGAKTVWDSGQVFPPPRRLRPASGTRGQEAVRSVVLQAYDIRRDDAALRALKGIPGDAAAERFDRLRTGYSLRCEYPHFIVDLAEETGLASVFRALGFGVVIPGR